MSRPQLKRLTLRIEDLHGNATTPMEVSVVYDQRGDTSWVHRVVFEALQQRFATATGITPLPPLTGAAA